MSESAIRMLVLDDDPRRVDVLRKRFPDALVTAVDNAQDCIARLAEVWDVVRLDHDLGGESFVDSNRPDCGMEVVRYLVRARPDHLSETVYVVHTRYESAGQRMARMLEDAGYNCTYQPFSWRE